MTVKDLLSALEHRGLKVVYVASVAQPFIDVSGSNGTLEELLYYCGIKVPDGKTVAGLLADEKVLATNVGELVGIDSVKQWLEDYLPQIKDMTPYALIAVVANDNTGGREYTADQLKSYADAFIDLAEEALGIRATVKDGVLKELRWNLRKLWLTRVKSATAQRWNKSTDNGGAVTATPMAVVTAAQVLKEKKFTRYTP